MATLIISLKGIFICSIAALFCSYQFMLQGAPSVMVPQLMFAFNLDVTDIGWLTSSFLYLYLLFQVPGGYLAERCNARLLLTSCSLLMAGACYWFSVAETIWSAGASRAFMGVITAPVIVVCMTLVSRWFPERHFPTLSGLIEAFALAGGGIGPIVLPDIMACYGWQGAMQAAALFGVVLAGLIALFVKSHPPLSLCDLKPSDSVDSVVATVASVDRSSLMLCCLYGFGLFATITSFGGLWGIPFFCERFPGRDADIADMVSLLFVGAAIGAPLLGWLACLLGKNRIIMMASATLSPLFFSLLIFYPGSMTVMGLLCFLAGVSSGGYMLAFSAVKSISPPGRTGLLLATTNGAMLLAGPVMQPLIGVLLESLGGGDSTAMAIEFYQLAFMPLLACQLLALLAALRLKKL